MRLMFKGDDHSKEKYLTLTLRLLVVTGQFPYIEPRAEWPKDETINW